TKDGLDAALSRLKAYAAPRRKRLLIVEDNTVEQMSIKELLGHDDLDIVTADSGAAALAALTEQPCDCVVLDLRLPDMSGFEVLERISQNTSLSDVPVVVFTGRELSAEEDAQLHMLARSVVVKGVESPERLLDETALFLHRVEARLPEPKRKMLEHLHDADSVVAGKTILVVDDDVRNIFSLTSMLEDHGMNVRFAENGAQALEELKKDPNVDVVLMDVMMPEMDGYETTKSIRRMDQFKALPIIALTAKAMKGDREKCIAAGASDYITKPVDTEQLLSLLRVWLYR
ncbi:MAG: response regulator, partial [Gemmatimonadaceae bacterium]